MLNSINLISQHMEAARAVAARCLNWVDATTSCRSSVRLDELITVGTTMRKRLQACRQRGENFGRNSSESGRVAFARKPPGSLRMRSLIAVAAATRAFRASTVRGTAARRASARTGLRDTCTSARGRSKAILVLYLTLGHAIDAYPKATTDHYLRPTRSTPPTPSPSSPGPSPSPARPTPPRRPSARPR